jgi:hypothetical protein
VSTKSRTSEQEHVRPAPTLSTWVRALDPQLALRRGVGSRNLAKGLLIHRAWNLLPQPRSSPAQPPLGCRP